MGARVGEKMIWRAYTASRIILPLDEVALPRIHWRRPVLLKEVQWSQECAEAVATKVVTSIDVGFWGFIVA